MTAPDLRIAPPVTSAPLPSNFPPLKDTGPPAVTQSAPPRSVALLEIKLQFSPISYPEILLKDKDSVPTLEGFELLSSTPVRFGFTVEGEQIGNLLSMTPHFWRISAEGAKRLKETEKLTDTASCVVNVYRPI